MTAATFLIQDLAIVLLGAALGGWLCRRVNLSPIVGYLTAGLAIGNFEFLFPYVSDRERVQVLSQIGMVFLMFSIGLSIRLKQLRAMGLKLVIAVLLIALTVMTLSRSIFLVLGSSVGEALFFAALLMVSSSAVIGKVLQETNQLHARHGQLALAITLFEDFVAVILLAFLGSYAALSGVDAGDQNSVLGSVGLLVGFVVLVIVPGIVWLPWILRKIQASNSPELETSLVAGILFVMALVTERSGYSLALGAFLCGILVAESSLGGTVRKSFTGAKDIFATVFFVAVGMSINLNDLLSAWPWILGGVFMALVLRSAVAFLTLLLVCENHRDALRAALTVTAIGEFSFIIAALGVETGVMQPEFKAIAVGVSFFTTLITPILSRGAGTLFEKRSQANRPAISSPLLDRLLKWLENYQQFWAQIDFRANSAIWWRLTRNRFLQLAAELVFVSALLVFSMPLQDFLEKSLQGVGLGWGLPGTILYLIGLILLGTPALVALIRNGDAVIMILGEASFSRQAGREKRREQFVQMLRLIAGLFLIVWFINIFPWKQLGFWGFVLGGSLFLLALIIGWRHWIRLHSNTEAIWKEVFADPNQSQTEILRRTVETDWNLKLEDLEFPENFAYAGKTIGELGLRQKTGVAILAIERHGTPIPHPGPQTHLYGGDRVLLLGQPKHLASAKNFLMAPGNLPIDSNVGHVVLQTLQIQERSNLLGKSLAELQWPRLFGVQVAAIRRGQADPFNPERSLRLESGDELLLAGSEDELSKLREEIQKASS
ncbi:MAG: cation:proton antiporter [Puniceicoccaceae bacterium]